MSNKDSELRDKITALVFEWHQEVSKLPRGETISFYKDKEVMELIAAYSHQREQEMMKKHVFGCDGSEAQRYFSGQSQERENSDA